MKRKDLIRAIKGIGCVLIRYGGRHEQYDSVFLLYFPPTYHSSGRVRAASEFHRSAGHSP